MSSYGGCATERPGRPRHEAADIFRAHGEAYRALHALTAEQRKVMWAIEACRTSVLGGHMDKCADCGHEQPSYNSCRNRHCPKCQALAQARWLHKRRERILPVHYFHVVFTLPGELRLLMARNRRALYELLFRSASRTLLTLGRDPNRLGALLGVTAVLHTWTRDLRYHPHLHCIVTGGGLATDGQRWVDTSPRFLFPVKVLSRLFRAKFLKALEQAHEQNALDLPGELQEVGAFARLMDVVRDKPWVVYAKRPFAGPDQVFSYLGRYTHRVGISNRRILDVTDQAVTIATRGDKTATMSPLEFIRRFLQHVLPRAFVKIRHYGLMAGSNVKTRLELARRLLAECGRTIDLADADPDADVHSHPGDERDPWRLLLKQLTGLDLTLCPVCGSHRMNREPLFPAAPPGNSPVRAPPDIRGSG